MKISKILRYLDQTIFQNKNIFIIFFFIYILFCFSIIDQYSTVLSNPDLYRYFLGDGASHIGKIWEVDNKLSFHKIHKSGFYFNNYYIFPVPILKFLKIFFAYNYSLVGISAVIVNLISIFVICVFGYLICFNITKSKIFSLGIILLLWHGDLITFALRIYPDILQLALIFLAVYFATLQNNFKWLFSFVFCGLAFGVKAQGLLIFIYLIILFFIFEFSNYNFKINNIIISFSKTILYVLLFLGTFFILNQIDPMQLLKDILFVGSNNVSDLEFDNSKRALKFLTKIFREESNIIIFLITISIGYFLNFNFKKNKILFLVTLIILLLFYYQLSNNSFLLHGTRYLYHLLPLIIILLSISFNNISNYLYQKKLSAITLIYTIIILSYGLDLFNKTFFNSIKRYDFKNRITNDKMIKGYNFLKSIKVNYKNPLVCAGHYSAVPIGLDGYERKKVLKSYRHLDFEEFIKEKKCDIIVLDKSTPGRYIWFKDNLDNIIVKKYEKLGKFAQMLGKDKIERTQQLINYILKDSQSGYEVIFYNSKMIVLTKK